MMNILKNMKMINKKLKKLKKKFFYLKREMNNNK